MKNNLAKLFLIISLFFGTLFIFIVPSFNSPDEDSHFIYAYETSVGNFIPKVTNKVSGYDVPLAIFEGISETKPITEDKDNKYKYSEMYDDQMLPQDFSKLVFNRTVIQNAPKIAYLAPALGIFVARHSHIFSASTMSTHVLVQFARFFSLLVYSVIGYLAIRMTPKFKKSFFAVLLLPLAVFLRSMVTYDGILLVTVALVLAEILRLIDGNTKITKKDYALLILTGFILLNVKMLYSIVFFGLLAVPKEVFGGDKKKKIKSIIFIAGTILVISYLRKIPYMFLGETVGDPNIPVQMNYIKSHPFSYLKTLVRNVIGQRRVQEYWMLATLGHLDTYLPVLMLMILRYYLILVFMLDALYERIRIPKWVKIGYFILVLFDIAGMYTMMYLSWTPAVTGKIGGNEITGIQGRYYLPFLFLVPIIFNNKLIDKIPKRMKIYGILNKLKEIFDNNFYYITIMSLIVSTFILIIRYYC